MPVLNHIEIRGTVHVQHDDTRIENALIHVPRGCLGPAISVEPGARNVTIKNNVIVLDEGGEQP